MNFDQNIINVNLDRFENYYLGNGWYSDGPNNRVDYYNAFSIHYYSLIYCNLESDDIIRNQRYKERAFLFAREYLFWFSENGSSLPFGRSLTYKFAQCSFWSALVYSNINVLPLSVLKGLINRNLRYFLNNPIMDNNGILLNGYVYPMNELNEEYNSVGSPYWALKAFLILAIQRNHMFWNVMESPLPKMENHHYQSQTSMIICREDPHVCSFINGQSCSDQLNSEAKYEKFLYSNIFGFTIQKSSFKLNELGFDNNIVVKIYNSYFIRSKITTFINQIDKMVSIWEPLPGIKIKTIILPGLPYHVRIHIVQSSFEFELYDGGFSIEQSESCRVKYTENNAQISVENDKLISSVLSLDNNSSAHILQPISNSHLLYAKSIYPYLQATIQRNESLLINCFHGKIKNSIKFSKPKLMSIDNEKTLVFNGKVYKINDFY